MRSGILLLVGGMVLLAGCRSVPPAASSGEYTPTEWQHADPPLTPPLPAVEPEPDRTTVELSPPTRTMLGPVPVATAPPPVTILPPPTPAAPPREPSPFDSDPPVRPQPEDLRPPRPDRVR